MDGLQTIDRRLFDFINRDLGAPFLDVFFPIWTDFQKHPMFAYLVLPLLLLLLVAWKNWPALRVLGLAAIATLAVDSLNHHFLKGLFARPRPEGGLLRISSQSNPSFPSSHALDAFCFAAVLAYFYPRGKWIFFVLASLSGFARVYLGVHYPSDVLGGALLGFLIGTVLSKSAHKALPRYFIFFLCLTVSGPALATWEDPTRGKPFGPWLWENQLKPTIETAVDRKGLTILGSGVATSFAVHQYDERIFRHTREHPFLFAENTNDRLGKLGNGVAGVSIAFLQLVFDQQNGLRHSRALLLSSLSHFTTAALVRRERPDNHAGYLPFPSSYPSGHATSAFTTAGALAYSYGYLAAIPAYFVAGSISLSRVSGKRHWASDIIAGAALGTFWARASFDADTKEEGEFSFVPSPLHDGMMITAIKNF